ncbi:CBN-CKB-1 protein [Caenorhabditis brenneri]|uniref:CBN-CKB-1 protein n=1 Tax=Caenorhabditis brenneri TaxID=135651 RepID=G0ME37_CAEBE|nr:CBN-CKB-1 protein [Caenorhabditis brenneri]
MEEYIPSRTLDAKSVLDLVTSNSIGATFPRYHSMDIPLSRNRRCFQVMREVLKEYETLGGGDFPLLPTHVSYSDHPDSISLQDLHKEIDEMESYAREVFEDTVVFCHNDLTCANILELNSTKELMFIDWEFASYNCRGFDLAMFLSETAIARGLTATGAQINEKLTNDHPNIRGLCEAYVDADNKLKNRTPSNRKAEISKLIKECEFFWPICHLFWACFIMKFALIKYVEGVDIAIRGRDRLAVYFHLKPRSLKIYEEFKKEMTGTD